MASDKAWCGKCGSQAVSIAGDPRLAPDRTIAIQCEACGAARTVAELAWQGLRIEAQSLKG